jgi:hypothetical protein
MSAQSLDDHPLSLTTNESAEDNDILFLTFKKDTSLQIPVKYSLMKQWSPFIDAIKWDQNECRQIEMIDIPGVSAVQLSVYVHFILSKLNSISPILRVSPEDCLFLYKVENVYHILLIVLHLNIVIFINQLIDILETLYFQSSADVDKYIHICYGLLKHQCQKLLPVLLDRLLNMPSLLDKKLKDALIRIVNDYRCEVYPRFLLAAMYDLSFPPISDYNLENMGVVHARHVYLLTRQNKMIYPIIGSNIHHEVLLFERTQRSIVETIDKYGRSFRIGTNSHSPDDLFWFYCGEVKDGLIDVGTVTVNNVEYQLRLKTDRLLPTSIFKNGSKLNNGSTEINLYKVHSHHYNDSTGYATFLRSNYNTKYCSLVQKCDTKFRQWLYSRDMLTPEEILLLHDHINTYSLKEKLDVVESLRFQFVTSQIDSTQVYTLANQSSDPLHIMYDYDQKGLDAPARNARIYNAYTRYKQLYHDRVHDIKRRQCEYYSRPEIIDLEAERQSSRRQFFCNGDHYQGIVVVCKYYNLDTTTYPGVAIINVDSMEENNSSTITPYHTLSPIKHTVNLKDLLDSLSEYTLKEPTERDTDPEYSLCKLRSKQYLYYTDITFAFRFTPDTPYFCIHNKGNIHNFRLVDPSLLENIDNIKSDSHPENGRSKVKVMAYPYDNPLVYFMTSYSISYSQPYIWYQFKKEQRNRIRRIIPSNYIEIRNQESIYDSDDDNPDIRAAWNCIENK